MLYKDLETKEDFGGYLVGPGKMIVRLTREEGIKFSSLNKEERERIADAVIDGNTMAREVEKILK